MISNLASTFYALILAHKRFRVKIQGQIRIYLTSRDVPIEVIRALKRKGVDVNSVIEFSPGLNYREVLNLANREDRIFVTFDKDFGELVVREKVKVKGLILLRFAPKSPSK